ncbi:MAG: hypothetical protein P1U59_07795 [Alcanivorax sp.]|jgi:hypothetical protein|uniref:hypothetical protein n=1 Tax=Alcanivorax sp. TaxID=1872427 RepID=UPI0019C5DDAC|nr:hypothetical protein [Alcanivorax sp.]MBD3642873.1 hypothetical protein [Alcanivorax sp.]MDF1724409.1 hypothetical protein [Alcanivorax sp.]
MQKKFKLCLALSFIAFSLSGCQAARSTYNYFACGNGGTCTESFPRDALSQTDNIDKIVLAPPYYDLLIRDLDWQYRPVPVIEKKLPASTIDLLQDFGESYGISINSLHVDTEEQLSSLTSIYHQAFSESPEILVPTGEVKDALKSIGKAPTRQDPARDGPIALDKTFLQSESNIPPSCCIVLTRINGWQESNNSFNASVTSAMIFSGMTGSSGAAGYAGDVVVDFAILRLSDGQTVWSAQTTSAASHFAIRQGMNHYFSTVANLLLEQKTNAAN